MKKFVLIIIFLISITVVTVSFASKDRTIHNSQKAIIILELPKQDLSPIPESILPNSVEIIEREAFEGTAFVKIELPKTLTTIGDRAFANIHVLYSIRIHPETNIIASTAFAGSNHVTINTESNSYARKFARAQNIPFYPVIAFCAVNPASGNNRIVRNTQFAIEIFSSKNIETDRQWQNLDNYNIIGTLKIIFNEIQGRGPPLWEVT